MSYIPTRLGYVLTIVTLFLFSSCMNKPSGINTAETSSASTVPFKFDGAVSAINLSDTRIQIQWTKLNNSSLVTYRVFMLNADGSLSAIATLANTFSSYIISNLSPGTLYSFVVRGGDAAGNLDLNNNFVTAMTYAGITSSSVLTYSFYNSVLTNKKAPLSTVIFKESQNFQ